MVPNESEKKGRHRSPNYPAIGLREAVERVQRLYDADKRAGAPVDAALRHIGFSSRHGNALAVLSALRKFGLVEDAGGRVVPTQRAVTILAYPDSDPRKWDAIKESALSPDIYRLLYARYADKDALPSDDTLKAELEAEMGFNPNAIGGFVKDFKDTLVYSRLLDQDTLRLAERSGMPTEQLPATSMETRRKEISFASQEPSRSSAPRTSFPSAHGYNESIQDSGGAQEILQFQIGEDAEARILFRGRVTQEGIEKLRKLLEVSKDTYPSSKKSVPGNLEAENTSKE